MDLIVGSRQGQGAATATTTTTAVVVTPAFRRAGRSIRELLTAQQDCFAYSKFSFTSVLSGSPASSILVQPRWISGPASYRPHLWGYSGPAPRLPADVRAGNRLDTDPALTHAGRALCGQFTALFGCIR
ncbi:hypothetical protein IEO21_09386 [Rhodonia placenta]|uniref:Uncharacterized protein n=1 Tax=Rhodonia placenta TaxID=104341 RepID=A0A8H7TXT1_9APHY|nr:hypothetical protein IEO21_09386 [Postia placenta]